MDWNAETQTRFDQLRMKEITSTLTEREQSTLDALSARVETSEDRYLVPAIELIRQEQDMLLERLSQVQTENELLAKLLAQQEKLAADARRWLAQFDRRHRSIVQTYTHLTGEALAPLSPS